MQLPQIKIGKSTKRNFFDLTHDVNTTASFGFCQPTFIREFVPNSKIEIDTARVCRLAALPVPTFGRVSFRLYNFFVPITEVYPAFPYLQAQKSVRTAVAQYIPSTADCISNTQLFGLALYSSLDNVYDFVERNVYFMLNIRVSFVNRYNQTIPLTSTTSVKQIKDFGNSTRNFTLFSEEGREYYDDWYSICQYIVTKLYKDNVELFDYYDIAHILNKDFKYLIPHYRLSLAESDPLQHGLTDYQRAIIESCDVVDTYDYIAVQPSFLNETAKDKNNVDICAVPKVLFKLTPAGRNLFSIFNALRVSFGQIYSHSMIPLLSYYKAWFDKFNPGRNIQWLDTSAYQIIHGYYDNNLTTDYLLSNDSSLLDYNYDVTTFVHFIQDLSQCFYVAPIDPITCCTTSPVINLSDTYDSVKLPTSIGENAQSNISTRYPYGHLSDYPSSNQNALGIKLLERFLPLLNKNSVIGSKVDEYLKAHGISNGLPESNFIGQDDSLIPIDDVMSTVNNDESLLGEYAGKGYLGTSGKSFHFETKSFGTFVQFICIVPNGGYVQSTLPQHLKRYDFYQPEFDSLGMEPVAVREVVGRTSLLKGIGGINRNATFGFRPRNLHDKIQYSLHNGGFSFHSLRQQFLPYNLDRIFTEEDVILTSDRDTLDGGVMPHADESLRFIGNYPHYGNFDRIFYDQFGIEPNFIIHMVNNVKMWSPMKAISESYDTYDPDVDTSFTEVNRA